MQTNKNEYLKSTCGRLFRLAALFALCFPAFPLSPIHAAITQSINYQGFLISKTTNLPVETPQDLKFLIYAAPTGGTALFTETRDNVRVTKGRYDVEIGSTVAGGLPLSLFTDYSGGLWLEIQVDANGDGAPPYEPMSPRVKLQASPFAFNSLYASTASAATPLFLADVIGALPNTTFGAVTISTNLFVQGGISVGSISPGQKLAVAGVVESTGAWPACGADPNNYTCGFRFPDGSVQLRAAALTMWDVAGPDLFTINAGNTGIGDRGVGNYLTVPLARLHISSGAGAVGDMLLVTADTTELFRVTSAGEVHGGSYYGDGTTLTGLVKRAGDTMTGQLTLAGSSLTLTSAQGLSSPKFKLRENVEISSGAASVKGGILVSTHIYLNTGAIYYGNGSGLTDVVSTDTTKVLKTGDTMTGALAVTTLTVTGNAFSVAGSTLTVQNGNITMGGALIANGGITAAPSITVNGAAGGIYVPLGVISGAQANIGQGVTASSATFWGYNGPDDANSYSIRTASGIRVNSGVVNSPGGFIGDGSQLTNVAGTDSARLLKAGDTMTGNLNVLFSSISVVARDTQQYSFTVRKEETNITDPGAHYVLAVTTYNVGVQVLNPTAPLEVNKEVLISNADSVGARAQLHIKATDGDTFVRWSDPNFGSKGALGYQFGSGDFIYRAMGSDTANGGEEIFRIRRVTDGDGNYYPNSWQFGIGTNNPRDSFHVAANMLVSAADANPILYVSTTSGGVSIKTSAQTHALTVNGGINAVSSITAQNGFYGNGSGITHLSAGSLPQTLVVGSITAISGGAYNGVVFSTTVYATVKLSVGTDESGVPLVPQADLHVRGITRLDHKPNEDIILDFAPYFSADAFIRWKDPLGAGPAGVLGIEALDEDLVYRAGAVTMNDGVQAFRIKANGDVIFGSAGAGAGVDAGFVPAHRLHVLNNMIVSAPGANAVLFVSTGTGSVGISTGTPKERMHVASSFLVGSDRASAALYVSTQSGATGIGTGSPSPQAKLDVNGLAVFRSSLTISGTSLSGAQSAFEVIGSTLVVRYDGKVGVGVASPAERLDVNGKVKAAGFAASREIVTLACPGAATCTATCTAGKLVMGGGCSYAVGVDSMTATYPFSDTQWKCDYTGTTGNITAYAICSTVE